MIMRVDQTGFGDYVVCQDPDLFCYGVDAVILAGLAAEKIKKKNRKSVLDLGTGNGIIPVILAHKTEIPQIYGIEVQQKSFFLAEETRKQNHLEARLRFLQGDLLEGPGYFGFKEGSFGAVTMNPPYVARNRGILNEREEIRVARQETTADLQDFFHFAGKVLDRKGDLFVIQRPERIVDLCCAGRKNDLEPREMILISGNPGERPNLVWMHFVKSGGHQFTVEGPFSVRDGKGGFSEEMRCLYEKP